MNSEIYMYTSEALFKCQPVMFDLAAFAMDG